mgnify:CR=1 FL=1
MTILENEACGHLSLLTNLKELKEKVGKNISDKKELISKYFYSSSPLGINLVMYVLLNL